MGHYHYTILTHRSAPNPSLLGFGRLFLRCFEQSPSTWPAPGPRGQVVGTPKFPTSYPISPLISTAQSTMCFQGQCSCPNSLIPSGALVDKTCFWVPTLLACTIRDSSRSLRKLSGIVSGLLRQVYVLSQITPQAPQYHPPVEDACLSFFFSPPCELYPALTRLVLNRSYRLPKALQLIKNTQRKLLQL